MKKFWGILITAVALFVIFLLFIYSGIYNVSAMVPHNKLTVWVINTVKDNSIEHHSKDIKIPNLNDSTMIKTGFAHYREMCVGCHGAPGIKSDDIGKGLYPHPPNLAHSAKEMPASQLFWITKNGIKFTGMPAFGKTHSDQKIWDIVSFMETLPNMSKEQYDNMNKKIKMQDDD